MTETKDKVETTTKQTVHDLGLRIRTSHGHKDQVHSDEQQERESHMFRVWRDPKYKHVVSLPTRGSEGAAGYDLQAATYGRINAHSKGEIFTGLHVQIPRGTYGRVASRSGLSKKSWIEVGAGVLDEDYRGPVEVILCNVTLFDSSLTSNLLDNHSNTDFIIKPGDRIAQMILEVIVTPPVVEVESIDDLGETKRGDKGFGSTGVSALGPLSGLAQSDKSCKLYDPSPSPSPTSTSSGSSGRVKQDPTDGLVDPPGGFQVEEVD